MADRITTITERDARELPRFDFIARYLVVSTRKKADRALVKGKQVRRIGGLWQVLYGNGLVEYETLDAGRLFDYVRRGPLNYYVRQAEEFRALAYERGARKKKSRRRLDAEIAAALDAPRRRSS